MRPRREDAFSTYKMGRAQKSLDAICARLQVLLPLARQSKDVNKIDPVKDEIADLLGQAYKAVNAISGRDRRRANFSAKRNLEISAARLYALAKEIRGLAPPTAKTLADMLGQLGKLDKMAEEMEALVQQDVEGQMTPDQILDAGTSLLAMLAVIYLWLKQDR